MFFCSVVTTFLLLIASTDGFSAEEYLVARCKSRCITLHESGRVNCTSATCLLCIKPCDQQVDVIKDCGSFCGTYSKKNAICIKSCKFFKKLHKKAKRPGMCPAVTDTRLSGSLCNIDSDCPHQQKCCGCLHCVGNRTCLDLVLRIRDNNQRQQGSKTKILPPVARGFTVTEMRVTDGKSQIQLLWKPPHTTDLQVHRYKLFWSKRLDSGSMMQKLASLRVHHISVPAGVHKYTLQDLECQTSYMLELQVVYQQAKPRVRSKRVYLAIRTPSKEAEKVQEDPHKGDALRKNRWWKRKKLPLTEHEVVTKGTQSTNSHKSPTNGPVLNVAASFDAKQSGASQTAESHILLVSLASAIMTVLLQGQLLNHIFNIL